MTSPNPTLHNGMGKPCKLALNSRTNIVAKGCVFERVGPDDKVHHKHLGENYVRVSVDTVYTPDAPLPVPCGDELVTVMNAHNSHVAWPKEFVIVDAEVKL